MTEIKRKRGTFQMAQGKPFSPGYYETTSCYRLGCLAVHRSPMYEIDPQREWIISHAATGLAIPYAYAPTLKRACEIATALLAAADWSQIKRGKSVGASVGMTPEFSAKIKSALRELGLLRDQAA